MKLEIMKSIESILVPVIRLVHQFIFISTLGGNIIFLIRWSLGPQRLSDLPLAILFGHCLEMETQELYVISTQKLSVAHQFSATFPPSYQLTLFFTIEPKQKNVNNHSRRNHEPSAVTDPLSENNKPFPCSRFSSRNFSGLKVLI